MSHILYESFIKLKFIDKGKKNGKPQILVQYLVVIRLLTILSNKFITHEMY